MVICSCIQESDVLDSGTMNNSITDLMILKQFKIANKVKCALVESSYGGLDKD